MRNVRLHIHTLPCGPNEGSWKEGRGLKKANSCYEKYERKLVFQAG